MSDKLIPIGTQTKWGEVSGYHFAYGERYYFLIAPTGVVSLIPASIMEEE